MQLHLQVSPADFAQNWNAAQVLAGPQLALGANSPYFFGHQLWSETRIELFAQATDTRPDELKTQGVRPRVWFGERWITSIFDLFEENVRYFPSLLPELSDEDPVAELADGRTPQLAELRLHNGTIYRWNRPVYDVVDGRPHLRVENRVLPAGPTVVDMMANAAFYYGMLRTLSEEDRPLWTKMSFAAAQHNFARGRAARHGRAAVLARAWRGDARRVGAAPAAADGRRGSASLGVAARRARPVPRCDRGPREDRAQRRGVAGGDGAGAAGARAWPGRSALAEMLRLYCERMHSNEPVHTWDGRGLKTRRGGCSWRFLPSTMTAVRLAGKPRRSRRIRWVNGFRSAVGGRRRRLRREPA